MHEKILFIGGFDEVYNYSSSIVKVEISKKDGSVFISKDIIGLPLVEDRSFWFNKYFTIMDNESEKETIAVNINCFNHVYVFFYSSNQFKVYTNVNDTLINKNTFNSASFNILEKIEGNN